MVGENQEQLVGAGGGGSSGSNKTPTLEEYGTNLTTQANEVGIVNEHVHLAQSLYDHMYHCDHVSCAPPR